MIRQGNGYGHYRGRLSSMETFTKKRIFHLHILQVPTDRAGISYCYITAIIIYGEGGHLFFNLPHIMSPERMYMTMEKFATVPIKCFYDCSAKNIDTMV